MIKNSEFTIENGKLVKYKGNETILAIPDGVTSIGNDVFTEDKCLRTVIIPYGVKSIENDAFSFCINLNSIHIPYSVTSIGMCTFYACCQLPEIKLPDSITKIGKNAFEDCGSLTSFTIPKGITNIETSVFEDCDNLSEINFHENLKSIGNGAFSYCYALKNIIFPNSLEEIQDDAFYRCYGIEIITIPKNVKSIGESSFCHCENLKCIIVDEKNPIYDSRDFSNAIIETSTNTLVKGCSKTIIPNTVTRIGDYAFCGCLDIESITIPDGVTSIGESAFSDCTSLKSITIPDSVISIGKNAFRNCENLKSIKLSNAITSIKVGTFQGCTNLTSVTIPDSVISIEDNAFYDCNNLKFVSFPDSVSCISSYVFNGRSETLQIKYSGELKRIPLHYRKYIMYYYLMNRLDFNTPTGKDILYYILSDDGMEDLMSFVCDDPAMLTYVCERKLIRPEDIELFRNEMIEKKSIECAAILMDYEQNKISPEEREKVIRQMERIQDKTFEKLFEQRGKKGIEGLVFIQEGYLQHFENVQDLNDQLESKGAKLISNLSIDVDYMISQYPKQITVKKKKAKLLGIHIISENELLKMME